MKIRKSNYENVSKVMSTFGKKTVVSHLHFSLEYDDRSPAGVISFSHLGFANNAESLFGQGVSHKDIYQITNLFMPERDAHLLGWFVKMAVDEIKATTTAKAVIIYSDDIESAYADAGFGYYGFTKPKSDFWVETESGTLKKHKGPYAGLAGKLIQRPTKHRYIMMLTPQISPKIELQTAPKSLPKGDLTPISIQEKKEKTKPEFHVIKIKKADLFSIKYESLDELMKRYREMAVERGLSYKDHHKIGVRTWQDDKNFYLKNFYIADEVAK